MSHLIKFCFLSLLFAVTCSANSLSADSTVSTNTVSLKVEQTSLTLAEIVSEQNKNYDMMHNGRGDVVGSILDLSTTQTKEMRIVVFFTFDGQDSITMCQPWDFGTVIPDRWNKQTDWSRSSISIISNGNLTYNLPVKKNSTDKPELKTVTVNSKIKEANKFSLRFHPKLLGDMLPSLNELFRNECGCLITKQVESDKRETIVVDFSASDKSFSGLRFVLDPQKAYLAESIIEYRNGMVSKSAKITIGQLPNKLFIPAKMECYVFDENQKAILNENWYYRFIEIDKGVPALELSGITTGLVELDSIVDTKSQGVRDTTGKNPKIPTTAPQILNKHDADL